MFESVASLFGQGLTNRVRVRVGGGSDLRPANFSCKWTISGTQHLFPHFVEVKEVKSVILRCHMSAYH
jgi:hypothetical protein